MRRVGNLVLAISLAGGVLAAATAYNAPLDLPAGQLEGLTLAADAGVVSGPKGKAVPLIKKGETLTASAVERLRANGVEYVRLQEFNLGLWPGRWMFVAAVAGLLTGALLLRQASRRQFAAPGAAGAAEGPEQAVRATRDIVDGLLREFADTGRGPGIGRERLRLVLGRLDEAQRTHMPAFVDARPVLVARLGLGGYAALMDRYAAAERQINRAWSAAADGADEEAAACLDLASHLLDEAAARLART